MKKQSYQLSGILMEFNKPNKNGRIYPKDVFEKAIKEYNLRIIKKQRKEKLEKLNENTYFGVR